MFIVAAYAVVLLVMSVTFKDSAGRDVDLAHLFMGLSMGGMFETRWAFWPSWFWEATFGILLVWFVTRSAESIYRFGLHIPHEAVHAAMSLAMLLMYWFPKGSSPVSMGMSMSSSSHAMLDPGIGVILAFTFAGSAIFTLASPNKGASHHGTHLVRVPVRVVANGGTENRGWMLRLLRLQRTGPGQASPLSSPTLDSKT